MLGSIPEVGYYMSSDGYNDFAKFCDVDIRQTDESSKCNLNSQDLTRFAIQAKGPDGKWTRKPLAYRESNNVHLLITCPPEICVNLVFKHIHAASSYTICRQFVPFIYCPL